MRVLVCGGRDYSNLDLVYKTLSGLPQVTVLIHGAAKGADALAEQWAKNTGVDKILRFPANWKRDGRMAGVFRNHNMIVDGKPDLVVAFPGGKGTADMVRRARQSGTPVKIIKDLPNKPPTVQ